MDGIIGFLSEIYNNKKNVRGSKNDLVENSLNLSKWGKFCGNIFLNDICCVCKVVVRALSQFQ